MLTHVSEQLRVLFKGVVFRVWVDQHGGGIQLGGIGHLRGETRHIVKQEVKRAHGDDPPPTFSAKLFLPALTSITLPLRSTPRLRSSMKSLSSP